MEISFKIENLFSDVNDLIGQSIKLDEEQVGKIISVKDNGDGFVQCVAQIYSQQVINKICKG